MIVNQWLWTYLLLTQTAKLVLGICIVHIITTSSCVILSNRCSNFQTNLYFWGVKIVHFHQTCVLFCWEGNECIFCKETNSSTNLARGEINSFSTKCLTPSPPPEGFYWKRVCCCCKHRWQSLWGGRVSLHPPQRQSSSLSAFNRFKLFKNIWTDFTFMLIRLGLIDVANVVVGPLLYSTTNPFSSMAITWAELKSTILN